MHLVGSETLAVVDGAVVPAGQRHAVGPAQRAVCSEQRPRFLWPALAWDALSDAACRTCAEALSPAAEPYPLEHDVRPGAALMLWQPSLGQFHAQDATAS